ncbi:MAG: TIGR04282 family arsenosugar biosynthesis glycosyltransferase [Desulfobulbaceae bacterium]|nr:TIGR04282 family arsenosugar biosynthesis glycosyltransferase [Desulfobulbaceae bacterium]
MAARSATDVEHLILFTRYPEPGQVKTRLIPALGAEGAATVQRRMTEAAAAQAESLAATRRLRLEICYDGGDPAQVAQWLAPLAPSGRCRPQGDGDLGQRMQRAMELAFVEGARRVVLLGCDCPALTAATVARAFDDLRDHDLVLGPALDGGYYLLGLAAPQPSLFAEMAWGDEAVLARTMARAAAASLRVSLLEALADVDRPEDLCHLGGYPHP